MSAAELTYLQAARIVRDAVKDKSYRAFPIGQEAGAFLRSRRKRLTDRSYREEESCLDKLARHFPDLNVEAFEPPAGAELIEEFMDERWGDQAARTYNKNHSMLSGFFKWEVRRGKLHGDPMLLVTRAKPRGVYRETFTPDARRAIFAANPDAPDSLALRLLLTYALRKGALQRVQFRHFDFARRRLTIFTKGGKVQEVPIPDAAFWAELDIYMRHIEALPHHYLLCRQKTVPHGFDPLTRKATEIRRHRFPLKPMGDHGLHDWWYARLADAGLVPAGVTRGERMHKARHTTGQRVLDRTKGNLKAAQKLLGHASIQTTGDVYTDWDIDQLEQTMTEIGRDE